MKLNAKISSERASRVVSKSGDEWIDINLSIGNKVIGTIHLSEDGIAYTSGIDTKEHTRTIEHIKSKT